MKYVYGRRKENYYRFACLVIALCCVLSACKSTELYGDGVSVAGIGSELSELTHEQSASAITGKDIEYSGRDIKRTAEEGAQYLDELGEILRRIRCQLIEDENGSRGNAPGTE